MPDINQKIEEVTGLISLPEIYLKLRRLLDDETAGIDDFAQVVIIDPNLSTQVLKMVNSAYFGYPEPVDSITRAINMIGLEQLHNLVLGASAMSSLDLPDDILPLKPFWHNGLYTGVLTQQLALKPGLERSDRLFIAGLLHEVGHLLLCVKMPDYAREAIRRSVQTGEPLHQVQQQMLGCHYGDIGAMLLGNWRLPEELQALVRYHPVPMTAPSQWLQSALLHLAHAYAGQVTPTPADADDLIRPEARLLIELKQLQINEAVVGSEILSQAESAANLTQGVSAGAVVGVLFLQRGFDFGLDFGGVAIETNALDTLRLHEAKPAVDDFGKGHLLGALAAGLAPVEAL